MSNLSEGAAHESCVWSSSLRFSMESVSMLDDDDDISAVGVAIGKHIASRRFFPVSQTLIISRCRLLQPSETREIYSMIDQEWSECESDGEYRRFPTRSRHSEIFTFYSLSLLTRPPITYSFSSSSLISLKPPNMCDGIQLHSKSMRSARLWSVRKSYRKPINYKFKVF